MTTGNQNAVGPFLNGLDDIKMILSSGAGNADDADIWRILNSADASQIGFRVSTPVAFDSCYGAYIRSRGRISQTTKGHTIGCIITCFYGLYMQIRYVSPL